MPAAGVLLFALVFFVWIGCGEENVNAPETPSEISALNIICNPLSPAPGDTAWLTVQPVGTGGVPSYEWWVGGGTLLSRESISVQWAVPDTPGVFRVSVKVTLGTAVDTMGKYVMLRRCVPVETGIRFSYDPRVSDSDVIITGSNLTVSDPNFFGYHVYRLGTPVEQITSNGAPSVDGGFSFTFIGDDLLSSVVTNGNPFLRRQSMNVILFPLTFGSKRYVSNNDQFGSTFRRNRHLSPSATRNLKMVAWQAHSVGGSEDGRNDLVNIAYRKETGPIQILTIAKDSTLKEYGWLYRYFRNIKPMFTPDESESNILYFVDSTGTYEPCLIPVDAATGPAIGQNREIGGPAKHGIFYNSNVQISEKTVFQWNPKAPTQLGFIDVAGNFCLLDYDLETVDIVSSVGKIQEFAWSDDGEAAVINKTGVLILTPPGGAPDTAFVKERIGDGIAGVNWSLPGVGEQSLGFRMVRKGISTAESFSALVLYSMTNKKWYFASPRIPASTTEPTVDYRWLRAVFDPSGFGMYVPVPTLIPAPGEGDQVVIYHSY
jgi:hypothetical protein